MTHRTSMFVSVAAGLGALFYGLFLRWTHSGVGMGFWDVDLELLQDRQLYVYVLAPCWLAGCVVDVRFLDRREVRIRFGSFRVAWARAVRHAAGRAGAVVLAFNLGAAAASTGLPLAAQAPNGLATAAYRSHSLLPVAAWAGSVALLAMGLVVVYAITSAIGVLSGSGGAIAAGVALWIGVLGTYQFGWPTMAVLDTITRFVALVDSPTLFWRVPLGIALVLAGCWGAVRAFDWWARGGRLADITISGWFFIAATTLVSGSAVRAILVRQDMNARVIEAFAGPGGTVLQLLIALFLVVGFAAVLAFELLLHSEAITLGRLIRYGSPAREFRARAAYGARKVALLAIAETGIAGFLLLVVENTTDPIRGLALLGAAFLSSALASLLVFVVFLTVITMRPSSVALAVAIIAVVSIICGFPRASWNPFALHGAWISFGAQSVLGVFAVLAGALAITLGVGVWTSRWRQVQAG